ncbi:hypothetical protein KM043_012507 [Ampulex compressa]|nr:hypothetical protein KM043_012507 [Ampulex compressa]
MTGEDCEGGNDKGDYPFFFDLHSWIDSYRSWLERIRKERPAFLTIVSLELPDSPLPLIESQSSARWRYAGASSSADTKDEILDELLEKVTEAGKEREKESRGGRNDSSKKARRSRKRDEEFLECTKAVPTLEECTKNIVQGRSTNSLSEADLQDGSGCICSEIPENLRIDIRKKTEVASSSRSPSPEVTHTIRIAMKYHGQSGCRADDRAGEGGEAEGRGSEGSKKDLQGPASAKKEPVLEDGCCSGVNVALDFTLNCSGVRLTSRDISLKAGTRNEKQGPLET